VVVVVVSLTPCGDVTAALAVDVRVVGMLVFALVMISLSTN
jgi:hypothetical protein